MAVAWAQLARSGLIACLALVLTELPCAAAAQSQSAGLRVGLTPVFLDDRTAFLERWRDYLQRRLDKRVQFVQRQTYQEITDLLTGGELDAAWLCGFPFVMHRQQLRLLAVPLYRGAPLYRSYLIVPATDRNTQGLKDLQQKVFAYSDPSSNSGYLVPRVMLRQAGHDPDRFFARTFFAWSHRDVIAAVADGLAQGGAVDGYVWDTLELHTPELTARTRVVHRSRQFGFPPFVAPRSLTESDYAALHTVFLEMASDPEGATLLHELNLDGFTVGEPALYESIRRAAEIDGH